MKTKIIILTAIFFLILSSFHEPKEVQAVQAPSKITVTNAFLPKANSEPRTKPITHIVIHFSSNVANNPKNPYQLQDIRKLYVQYGVSAHYIIGRKGEIYRLVPETQAAYHAGKGSLAYFPTYTNQLNQYSIGIELMAIGTKKEMSSMISPAIYNSVPLSNIGYTSAQYRSLTLLVDDITKRNPSIKKDRKHIIGHSEYAPGRKSDPGSLFQWSKIGF
ncbi:N-acetylmuramoyl-L-alanine amidase [Neobacillus sp. LXY-1]|uniref:N-acetylmuramoyl-L-alanine amidase n=1 Tax=Neobacillus sp. LXY-1 TaxID=3379133 RepID=UPI003EDF27BD